MRNPSLATSSLALPALFAIGCSSIGPGTVARDRYEYSDAISESWKRQTLLNIVKLRYLDPPIFVDVGQIVAGYTLETGVTAAGQLFSGSGLQADNAAIGVQGKFTDRPTITYTPLTGNHFVKALMTPLPPEAVFFMIQSGWAADGVLFAAAASINGLKNQETSISGAAPPDPKFLRALELLRAIQLSGGVSMRVQLDREAEKTSLLTFRSSDVGEETLARIRELRELLKLDPDATDFTLVFGGTAANDREVAVITRSILHIMTTMAAQVDVPELDIAEGRATPGLPPGDQDGPRMVRVHCGEARPTDASVSVFYRERWFWIDDRDLRSKRAFAFMLMLFTLSDPGQVENLPLITIPAQ